MTLLMACDPLQHKSMYQRDDSEDSDGEGGLGNVSRVLIRPAGTTGKAKKGHLCFDASFETGNLGRVDLISEFEYDLFIRPDTCSPRFRIWFNFTVDNYKLDQRVVFNVVNLSKSKTLFRECLTPLVKSTSRPQWQRLPRRNVWYHRSAVHQGHHVISFAFAFDKEDEVFQFAMALPYSYSRLQSYLTTLEKRALSLKGEFSRETIGSSVQKRKVDLITIGQIPDVPDLKDRKRVVVILARVHPGEAPASYVCQGIMDLLTSNHQIATSLRERIVFKIVPMLNPDGVFLGNYKSTLMGFDLNRSWHIASPWAHPTLWAVLQMLKGIDNNDFFQLDFVIDLHAHSSLTGCFIYGNTYEDIYRYERHIVFPKLLGTNADDYAPQNTMFNTDAHKAGTARRYLCNALSDHVNCYTMEVSLGGYILQNASSSGVIVPYTKESYMRVGRNLTRTFINYYKLIGVFTEDIPMEIRSRRRPHTYRHKSRSPDRSRSRPRTTRCQAILHYTDILSELEEESEYYPNSFVRKNHCDHEPSSHFSRSKTEILTNEWKTLKQIGGGGFVCKMGAAARQVSPPPKILTFPPPPSLTIIDFNQLTRSSLDQAIGKYEEAKKKPERKSLKHNNK